VIGGLVDWWLVISGRWSVNSNRRASVANPRLPFRLAM
jgi:hypothetical protein